jgi:subtilisin family serine protease
MNKSLLLKLLALPLASSAVLMTGLAWAQSPPAVPPSYPYTESRPMTGRYIVVFKATVKNAHDQTTQTMRGLGGQVHHVYNHALKGFAASLPASALPGIQNNPNVDYVEQDQTVSLNQSSPQQLATWGLDRVDEQERLLNSQYYFNYTGLGVNAFIIDTGIRADHVDFAGRVQTGHNTVADTNGTHDCNGHGTHVAGTVGGSTWGVAKSVNLIPVRVLDCAGSGSWSGVISGIDWVAQSSLRPAVANLSLGGGKSTAVNAAVAGAVSQGVTMVVAAGNSNADACRYSPASEPSAITVAATTSSDQRASYSNYGKCVDIFAPGSSITSAWHTAVSATNTISGTSMASPHVAGVAALALAANPLASPAAVDTFLKAKGTGGLLSSTGTGSPNLLVYALASGAPVEAPPQVVAVESLSGNGVKSGANWRASVTATIRNTTGAHVANATVAGSFSPGGTASCLTDSNGSCTLTSANINRTYSLTVMTVTQVSGTNLTYDPNQNWATATSISIPKP